MEPQTGKRSPKPTWLSVGTVLLILFAAAAAATGWYAWRTLSEYVAIPAEEALARQSALISEITTLHEVERAYTAKDSAALQAAINGAVRTLSEDPNGSSDLNAARANVRELLARLGQSADENIGVRLFHAARTLEQATLAANEHTRVQVAKRNVRVQSFWRSLEIMFGLLILGGVGLGAALLYRVRDADRLQEALTAARESESALGESRRQMAEQTRMLQTTLDNINQGFAVWDSAYRLVIFNAKCLDLWYHPLRVEAGMPMIDLLRHLAESGAFGESAPPEELASRSFDRVIAAGPDSDEEFTLIDGRVIYVRRHPMPDGGHASVYSDVTEERRQSGALQRAKLRAEEANQAKSEFLSAMSHELRTPLNAVLGFGQVLRDSESDPLTAGQREAVDHILTAGKHLLGLINEVLDLAKVEAGRMVFQRVPVDVHSLLTDALPMVKGRADERGIRVETPDIAAPGPVVVADPKRLYQVILNLLTNAVKYNRENGAVSVTVEPREGKYLRLAISDTGPGVPEDRIDALFRPFDRLGAEHTDIEGSGIGLTICRELMEGMEGEIGVTSRPGDGATFWIDIPSLDTVA